MPEAHNWPPGLIISGTDTGVGKTHVAVKLIESWRDQGARVGAIKPVSTGCTERDGALSSDDVRAIADSTGWANEHEVGPFLFEPPIAPSVAARLSGRPLTIEQIFGEVNSRLARWADQVDCVVIEGIGGFLCPIADNGTFGDLAAAIDYPVLIVARTRLGTLNHTLLTVEAIERRGLRIAGIVQNDSTGEVDDSTGYNAAELARCLGASPIYSLPHSTHELRISSDLLGVPWTELVFRTRSSLQR